MTEMGISTIHLHATDNVVVCTKTLTQGTTIIIMDTPVVLKATLGIGHKISCSNIQQGELIIKYGVPIGAATEPIPFGSHVHTHNMQSNYIPTYLIQQ